MLIRKSRALFVALVALLFYTGTDILVWQRVFETHRMVQFADTYHTGWFVSLAGYAAIGMLLMWGAWRDCLYFIVSLLVGAFSGLEDMLYYLLDRKPIPESLPWLESNPLIFGVTRLELIGSGCSGWPPWPYCMSSCICGATSSRPSRPEAQGISYPGFDLDFFAIAGFTFFATVFFAAGDVFFAGAFFTAGAFVAAGFLTAFFGAADFPAVCLPPDFLPAARFFVNSCAGRSAGSPFGANNPSQAACMEAAPAPPRARLTAPQFSPLSNRKSINAWHW
jgi:hypothetical protein